MRGIEHDYERLLSGKLLQGLKFSSMLGGDGGHFALCALAHSLTALESLR